MLPPHGEASAALSPHMDSSRRRRRRILNKIVARPRIRRFWVRLYLLVLERSTKIKATWREKRKKAKFHPAIFGYVSLRRKYTRFSFIVYIL